MARDNGVIYRFPINTDSLKRYWERYNPVTNETRVDLIETLQQMPNTWTAGAPRESSPTGKSGIGIAAYNLPRIDFSYIRKQTVLPHRPDGMIGHAQEQGNVDVYGTIKRDDRGIRSVKFRGK